MSKKPIIVSGIQPTGNLHVGNYLGAVKNWVELQQSGKYEMYLFIADLHSLTGKQTPTERRAQTLVTAAEIIAAGIDPSSTTLFVQSHIPEHTELAWIFNTISPMGELERMTQFKDKAGKDETKANVGLFTYPILQAADILLYRGELVPVGQDQIQHVELTRDIARWFNKKYTEFFPEVKHLLTPVPKVMSLLEPTKKMSKSLGEGHVIELNETPTNIDKKLQRAVTATNGGDKAPGVTNLLLLLEQYGDRDLYQQFVTAEQQGTIRYGDLKKELARAIGSYFASFRAHRAELLRDETQLAKILAAGAERARPIALANMQKVRELVGIR